ncbi:MAG: penicillin-binding transpeptidase domain-containing protein, partial [Planctomycetota bacterium]
LQAQVQAIMSHRFGLTTVQPWHENAALPVGWPLNGAAVVLDVHSGELLAAVSMPTLAMSRYMDEYRRKLDQPVVFRPTEGVYPPGSIIKPLVLCAAVQEGLHDPASPIECVGHYLPEVTTRLRCWIYREAYDFMTHGPLAAEEALARSCNIYFYTLADRLGMASLADWLKSFGLGQELGVGLARTVVLNGQDVTAGEAAGNLPSPDMEVQAISTGIGQGDALWTPVQAANAYATLARRGVVRDATLIREPEPRREKRSDFPLPESLVRMVEEGLRQSVEEPIGTGFRIRHPDGTRERIFNATGVTVWGKTGTAEAPKFRVDRDGDGEVTAGEPIENLDHAWFVGLVGPAGGEPLFAVAVIVEYGGSGGRVAGPVANQIIRAMQRLHYLPTGDEPTASADGS